MRCTLRVAHLESKPAYKVGDKITRGMKIGRMGNTGKSTAAHAHMDVVDGVVRKHFYLSDMFVKMRPNKRQLDYFIDNELFGVRPVITVEYDCPKYKKTQGVRHPAYDVVPFNRHQTTDNFDIFWNRSKEGTVELILDNDVGYGHCIYISFEC